MKKLLFAAILGSMAMASCSNEDTVAPGAPSTDGSKSNLRIEMIVDGISTKGNTEGMMTGGHPWVDGDQIRLFTLDHDKFEADGTVEKYSVQQRDCSGFSPDSLLILVEGTKI